MSEKNNEGAISRLSNWAKEKRSGIATTVATAFAGLVIGWWTKPNFSEATQEAQAQTELAKTQQPAAPDTSAVKEPGHLTSADIDVKKMEWTQAMEEFHRDYFALPGVGPQGEVIGANGLGYFWTLVRGQESRARKDGVYLAVHTEDPEVLRRTAIATLSAMPSREAFVSPEEFEKAFRKCVYEFIENRWGTRCKKELPQFIADQRARFEPYKEGQWPVPGIVRLYCDQDEKTRVLQVDLDRPGYVKHIEISDTEYYLMNQLSTVRDVLRKLKNSEKKLIISTQLPNLTVLEEGKDGVYRDVTRTGKIGALLQKTYEEHLNKMNVDKTKTYTIKTPDNYVVFRNGQFFDPTQDPKWMNYIKPAIESLKAIGGKLKSGAALEKDSKTSSLEHPQAPQYRKATTNLKKLRREQNRAGFAAMRHAQPVATSGGRSFV